MTKEKLNDVPKFRSPEEEKEYWEAQGPLAEGHRGRLQKPVPRNKRTSFLSVRFTGEELTQLRDMATDSGMGVSTFIRFVIKSLAEERALGRRHFQSLYDSAGKIDISLNTKGADKTLCILLRDDLTNVAAAFRQVSDYMTQVCKTRMFTPKDAAYEALERVFEEAKSGKK